MWEDEVHQSSIVSGNSLVITGLHVWAYFISLGVFFLMHRTPCSGFVDLAQIGS